MSVFPFVQATDDTPPTIIIISPSSGEQGQTLELTIFGMDFVDGASASFSPPTGITVISVGFVNHMELRATVTVAIGADVGPRDVTVTNPDNQSHTLSGGFTVTEAKPTISAITGLTATDAHDGKVDLTWNPSEAENFAHYAIYVAETEITDVTGLSPTATITDIAVHMYQVTGLKDGTTYYFAVTAVDTTGNENKAVTAASTIPTPGMAPTPGLSLGWILAIVLTSLAVIGGLVFFGFFGKIWDWVKRKLGLGPPEIPDCLKPVWEALTRVVPGSELVGILGPDAGIDSLGVALAHVNKKLTDIAATSSLMQDDPEYKKWEKVAEILRNYIREHQK